MREQIQKEIVVSIPQWCDCCERGRFYFIYGENVSIPQWCDCCPGTRVKVYEKSEFQSHNGAIAAISGEMMACNSSAFQSHNGAIAAKMLLEM